MGCLWSKKTVEEGEEQERLIGGTGIEARAKYGGNSTAAERVPFPSNDAAPPTPKRETEVKQSQQEKASDAQERKPVTRKLSFQETDKGAGVIQAGKLTGQALLQVAQNVPILAPVAFLLGAVSQSANEAVMLKADCNAFSILIDQLEGILVRAERIENHGGEVNEVREALTDALDLMEKMKSTGALKAFWIADSQRSKFEEIKERIEKSLHRLNLTSTIDTNFLARAKFEQSQQLKTCIESLGGVDAVMENPELMDQVKEHMDESEKLLHAGFQKVATQQEEVLTRMETMQSSQKKDMIEIMKQAELQKMQNEVLHNQVAELKALVTHVRDAMRIFPVPAKEPERMVILNQGGLMNLSPSDSSFEVLQDCTKKASLKWGLVAMVNFIGGKKQYTAAGYMPQIVIDEKVNQATTDSAKPTEDKMAVDLCGLMVPRKVSQCQHVVGREDALVFEGAGNGAPTATAEELGAAAGVDPVLGSFLQQMQSGQSMFQNERGNIGRETAMEIALAYQQEFLQSEKHFYAGVPIIVEGQTIGSFCILGPHAPKGGFGDTDLEEMKTLSARAAQALEKQLLAKRQEAAAKYGAAEKKKAKNRKKKNRKKKKKATS